MAFAQFRIPRVKDGVSCFCKRYVNGVVTREVVPQFPNAAQQRCMGVSFGWKISKCSKHLFRLPPIQALPGN